MGIDPKDGLGDRLKQWESSFERTAMKGLPLVARLDGRAFHTFTRSMKRPYDERLKACMRATAVALLEDLHPNIAYTQSDEITIAWNIGARSRSEYPFGGRIQKLASVLASIATEGFNRAFAQEFHSSWLDGALATFDCRVFQVPSTDDLLDVFVWREDDAVKNSVTMLAQSHYSHKELHEKTTSDKLQMLESKGVWWDHSPTDFKRGVYLRRVPVMRTLMAQELARIPEQHREPNKVFERSVITDVTPTAPIRRVARSIAIQNLGLAPKEE